MKLTEFTVELVTPVIEAIVAEYGEDYIYKAEERGPGGGGVHCVYFEVPGEPSCLVGHVIHRLGATEEINGDNNWVSAAGLTLKPTPVWYALNAAQEVQDTGGSWGKALVAYYKYLNKYS